MACDPLVVRRPIWNFLTHDGYAESACVGQLVCDLTDKAGGALVRGLTLHVRPCLGVTKSTVVFSAGLLARAPLVKHVCTRAFDAVAVV